MLGWGLEMELSHKVCPEMNCAVWDQWEEWLSQNLPGREKDIRKVFGVRAVGAGLVGV